MFSSFHLPVLDNQPFSFILFSGVIFVGCLAGGGCSTPGESLDQSELVFDGREGYVRAITSFLNGKNREKVRYTADELRKTTDGWTRHHGKLGARKSGNADYGRHGAVLTGGYDEDFEEGKFTLRQLHKIYKFVTALEEDHRFRKELGSVIYLLRRQGPVPVRGLKKDNTHGFFTVHYGKTEPGGAIVEKNGRPRVLFCEPRYTKGRSSYMATRHSIRAADLGTFHGHSFYPGPSSLDIVSNVIYRNNSFIIADRGNANGQYRANLNFVTDEGEGLDLTTVSLPKPDLDDTAALPVLP